MYFLLQSCSGHSNRTGEIAHGAVVLTFFAGICTFNPVNGLIKLFVSLSPFTGEGLSSFDFRFSGRGGRNEVGDVDGVLELVLLPELLEDELVEVEVVVAVVVVVVFVVDVGVPVVVVVRPPRPFAPPFRSLL